jgi:hypothetical protein
LHNLCLYLKTEIELDNITLNKENTEKLINLINTNLDLLNTNIDYDWKIMIDELNELCLELV